MNLLMTMKSSGNLAAQNSMADPQQKMETSPGKLNPDDILQKKLSSDEQIKLYFKNQSTKP